MYAYSISVDTKESGEAGRTRVMNQRPRVCSVTNVYP